MKSWKQNWDAISPIFKFSSDVRKVIYTTNAIESLNATYRKLNRQRSVFPSDTALLKALYLSTFEGDKEMDHAAKELGAGLWGIKHYVRRTSARIDSGKAKLTGGMFRLLLTCPGMCWYK